jgi:hypothetical protein
LESTVDGILMFNEAVKKPHRHRLVQRPSHRTAFEKGGGCSCPQFAANCSD